MFSPTTLEMARQYRTEQIRAAEQYRLAAQFKSTLGVTPYSPPFGGS